MTNCENLITVFSDSGVRDGQEFVSGRLLQAGHRQKTGVCVRLLVLLFLHQTACFTDYAIPHLQGYYDEGLAAGVVKIVRL
jgi:hypothetical protein